MRYLIYGVFPLAGEGGIGEAMMTQGAEHELLESRRWAGYKS